MRYLIGIFATLGLLSVVLFAALITGMFWFAGNFSSPPDLSEKIVLKVRLAGPLAEIVDTSPLADLIPARRRLSLFEMVQTIDAARLDDRVKGLVMDLSGSDVGLAEAQELRDSILRFRGATKFAHVFADTFEGRRGSASYYLATAFETISLQPSGLLDIRGLSITTPLLGRLLKEQGVTAEIHARHEFKSAAVPLTKDVLPDPVRANYERAVSSMFNQLVSGIATGRDLTPSAVRTMVDAAPLVARDARRNNLVDKLSYWDQTKSMVDAAASGASLVHLSRYMEARNADQADEEDGDEPRIAVISAEGEIIRGGGRSLRDRDKTSAGKVIGAIQDAHRDKTVKAILLRINSPGGSYVASDSILRALDQVHSNGIPIVVSMSDVAASGGYFIALAADHVVAQPATITGSIGVLGGKISFGEFLSRHGVEIAEVNAGANASMYSPLRPFNGAQRERLSGILDEIYADFTNKVATRRRLSPRELDAAARGRIWTGEDAHRLGLVDVLGGFEEAISLARQSAGLEVGQHAALTVFPRRLDPLEQLLDSIGEGDLFSLAGGIGDLVRLIGYAENIVQDLPSMDMSDGVRLRAPKLVIR
jgi:protease IV